MLWYGSPVIIFFYSFAIGNFVVVMRTDGLLLFQIVFHFGFFLGLNSYYFTTRASFEDTLIPSCAHWKTILCHSKEIQYYCTTTEKASSVKYNTTCIESQLVHYLPSWISHCAVQYSTLASNSDPPTYSSTHKSNCDLHRTSFPTAHRWSANWAWAWITLIFHLGRIWLRTTWNHFRWTVILIKEKRTWCSGLVSKKAPVSSQSCFSLMGL